MSIRLYKSYTPGTRNRALSDFSEITKSKPESKKKNKSSQVFFFSRFSLNKRFQDTKISRILWYRLAPQCYHHRRPSRPLFDSCTPIEERWWSRSLGRPWSNGGRASIEFAPAHRWWTKIWNRSWTSLWATPFWTPSIPPLWSGDLV